MKTIVKTGSLLAMIAVMTFSCTVERKTREGKKNVIDVGMNQKEYKNSMASVAGNQPSAVLPATR